MPQRIERIPQLQAYLVPIIEAGSLQLPIIQRKAKRLDQMQRRLCGQAKPTDIACVWGYLRPNQDNVKHTGAGIANPGSCDEILAKFTRYEFFQLHHVSSEFANPLARFFVRHRIVI